MDSRSRGGFAVGLEQHKGQIRLTLYENDRTIAFGRGETVEEAARWLVRHAHRIVQQSESLLIAAGHVTAETIDKIRSSDDLPPRPTLNYEP